MKHPRAAALLLMAAVAALAGCDAMRGGDQVKFASWGSPRDFEIYSEIFNNFETAYPGTEVSPLYIPFSSYFTKIQLLLVGRVGPDALLVSSPMAYQLQLHGHIDSLQPYIERERETDPEFLTERAYYIDMLKPAATFGGEFHYLPIGPMSMHVYYNKTMFDEAGVPYPAEGWTWDDFRDAAVRLTRKENGRYTQWGLLVMNWDTWWRTFLLQNGTDIFDDPLWPSRCLLDGPEAMETFSFLQRLIYEDHAAPTPAQASQMGGDFLTGKLAMQIHGTWMVEQYRQISDFEWDMAPLPMRRKYGNVVTVCGVAMAAAARDKERTWAFMRHLVSRESQYIMSSDCATWQPILRELAESDYVHEVPGLPEHHYLRFKELERAVPGAVLRHPKAAELLNIVVMGVEPIFSGKATPQDCLPAVAAEANAFLAEHPTVRPQEHGTSATTF